MRSSRPTRSARRTWPRWSATSGAIRSRSYGTLSADSNAGFALENQTLSLYPAGFLIQRAAGRLRADHGARARPPVVRRQRRPVPLARRMAQRGPRHVVRAALRRGEVPGSSTTTSDAIRAVLQPRATCGGRSTDRCAAPSSARRILDLFNPNVYYGGATVLYALRQVVGDRTFYEIERRWVQRYEGESASTDDFIALASKVSHRNLGPSCATGSTAPRRRRCRAIRTGPSTRPAPRPRRPRPARRRLRPRSSGSPSADLGAPGPAAARGPASHEAPHLERRRPCRPPARTGGRGRPAGADVVALQEVTARTLPLWRAASREAGYAHVRELVDARRARAAGACSAC